MGGMAQQGTSPYGQGTVLAQHDEAWPANRAGTPRAAAVAQAWYARSRAMPARWAQRSAAAAAAPSNVGWPVVATAVAAVSVRGGRAWRRG
jgi:hypothetical protein